MTTQTEAHELIRELEDEAQDNPDDYRWKAAAELLRLEAVNAELLEALKMNAQVVSWLSFGECRGFTEGLPTALEATEAARSAIKKHGVK